MILKLSKIFKRSFLWCVVLFGTSVLTFANHRVTAWGDDAQGLSCCLQAGLVNPNLGLLYLAFAPEHAKQGAESKSWRRDFVLALEKRRAKRQTWLALKTLNQSVLPLALPRAGARER